jgi:predicted HTH transcriptional regulator
VSEDTNKIERRVSDVLSEAEMKKVKPILDYLESHETITPKEARNLTGKSAATVRRYLALLCEYEILESIGNTSAVLYKAVR